MWSGNLRIDTGKLAEEKEIILIKQLFKTILELQKFTTKTGTILSEISYL